MGMARYSSFLGRRVEVHYRAGDILLPASGTLVADSGRSIFLEQHLMQRGQQKQFRWEIPYQYVVRLEAAPEAAAASNSIPAPAAPAVSREQPLPQGGEVLSSSSAAANTSGDAPSALPLRNNPKTA
jgi:hypothetical protein